MTNARITRVPMFRLETRPSAALLRLRMPPAFVALFILLVPAGACFQPVQAADGTLRMTVNDDNAKPLPCRIHLKDEAGKAVRSKTLPFWRDHFVCAGTVELTLPAGTYIYEIERGPEYKRSAGEAIVSPGKLQAISITLTRLANLASEGWYAGDLHVHRAVEDVPLLMQAEDLHIAPVITWWNNRNLWANRALPKTTLTQFDGNRYYDVMAGEDEREGGALMFFHLKKPLAITGATREYPSPMTFIAAARKRKRVWIDVEKPFWWDVPVWLASGQVDSIGLANNHMCRSQMYEDEAWGRPRDARRLPPPRGNGYWTQEIYYHILNSGLRIPPSAGSASGVLPNPVGYNRVYVFTGARFDYDRWWAGLKAGRSFVTNGPLLRVKADNRLPGHVFSAAKGEKLDINLDVSLISNDSIKELEIIKNGKVVRTVPVGSRSKQGNIGSIAFDQSGWFLIRAVTENRRTFRFASTAPFYVEVGPNKHRISRHSAQFFLDWTKQRAARVPNKLKDQPKLREVLTHHQAAMTFWQAKVSSANAK